MGMIFGDAASKTKTTVGMLVRDRIAGIGIAAFYVGVKRVLVTAQSVRMLGDLAKAIIVMGMFGIVATGAVNGAS